LERRRSREVETESRPERTEVREVERWVVEEATRRREV
jgi:hypothetical protein